MLLRMRFVLLVFCSFALFSCGSNHAPSGCPPLPAVSPLPTSHITGANVFLDASGSMKGFMKSNSDFQYLIPDLLDRLQRDLPAVHFFALSQKGENVQPQGVDLARRNIAFGNFNYGDATTLPAMFDTVLGRLQPGTITLLITDGIYTPPSADSKMKFQESTDITNAFSRPARAGMATVCLALHSAFTSATSPAVVSPYYIFVSGSPQDIIAFTSELNSSLTAVGSHLVNKELNEQFFGYPVRNIFYSIIPFADNTGAAEPVNCPDLDNRYLLLDHVDVHKDQQCWIGFDLAGIPGYIDLNNYLKNNLTITGSGLNAVLADDILPASRFASHLSDETDKALAAKCTHFVRIRLSDFAGKSGEVSFSLKKTRPSWVADFSHGEADHAETRRDKTYGLDNIFDGLEDAYGERSGAWFFKDLKIIVNKNE